MPRFNKQLKDDLKDIGLINEGNQKDVEESVIDEATDGLTDKELTVKADNAKEVLAQAPPDHLRFMTEYLKCGNATDAYLATYPDKQGEITRPSAAVGGSKLLRKYRPLMRQAMLDKWDITQQKFFKKITDLMEANKVVFTKQHGIQEIPDNPTQLQATKMLGEVLKELNQALNKGDKVAGDKIVIIKNEESGRFAIGLSEDIEEGEVVED